MKSNIILLSIVFLIFTVVAISFLEYLYETQTPTPWFENLDNNSDGEISRPEYEFQYQETIITSGRFSEFEQIDCNHNGRITWPEYSSIKMRRNNCATGNANRNLSIPGNTYSTGNKSIVLLVDEYNDLLSSTSTSIYESLEDSLNKKPDNYSEKYIDSNNLSLISINCTSHGDRELPIQYSTFSIGNYPALLCTFQSNATSQHVSLLIVKVSLMSGGESKTEIHAKTLAKSSDTEARLIVLYSRELEDVSVELLDARLM
jgi:hypothetical protein